MVFYHALVSLSRIGFALVKSRIKKDTAPQTGENANVKWLVLDCILLWQTAFKCVPLTMTYCSI
jgi:hypothetical protein